jgi:hypothetical protein
MNVAIPPDWTTKGRVENESVENALADAHTPESWQFSTCMVPCRLERILMI